ncbi:MAG: hypothetical protein ACYC63_17655 [Armatimonadota bacterium]
MDTNPNCERWMWIELIGFDNEQPDYNVAAFLDNAGFIPEGLCFLIASPDFVHTHAGLDREIAFPPDYCSYAGKPYNVERRRQVWTNLQLKGLVDELHQRGIKVFPSVFPTFVRSIDGEPYRSPWTASHPELWAAGRDGTGTSDLNPLKRFLDGTYYEDVFVNCLSTVVADYGFDGFHSADGYSSSRNPIWMVDYSDDMVQQFVEMMGVELPFPIVGGASDPEQATARADYIWQNLRHQWCEFYARRCERFHGKVCDAIHALGREVVLNNAWTRDPFEAYYRYGIDYRRVARAGADRFILETVGAGVSIGAESGFPADPRFDFNFMLAFTKACLPDTPLLCLNGTGDTTENWDILNHAPAVSEREIYTLGHTFVRKPEGYVHASAGPFVCLADGINGPQWQWLRENWETAYERVPSRVLGATVVWSEAALDAEFDDYEQHRTLTRQKIAGALQRRGAPLMAVINSRDLAVAEGCLLVPRPELLAPAELERLLAYREGPVMMIGRQGASLPEADLTFAEGTEEEQLCCRIYNLAGRQLEIPELVPEPALPLADVRPEPPNYLHELYFRQVSDEFLQACSNVLIGLTDTPRVVSDSPDLRVLAFEVGDKQLRVLVGNEAHIYVLGRVDLLRSARKVEIASHFPGRPIEPVENFIDIRVPPRGMIVLDVELV